MTTRAFERLVRMDSAEASWRMRAGARALADRARTWVRTPSWDRRRLASALDNSPSLGAARRAVARGQFLDAHHALAEHLRNRPSRFVIGLSDRAELVEQLLAAFPMAADDAAARADRLCRGEQDVLGYRGLRFGHDWHFDPVHRRRAPLEFWSAVPFLDPATGDHKVVWERNRHQHWLALGRAYWLTGAREYRDASLDELASWMQANPPLVGINWASMLEIGLRTISWTWALHFFNDGSDDDRPWIVDLLLGVDRQLTHVEQNLSYYFSPNTHLLGEALALYVVSAAFPELAASPRRLALGRRILIAERARQVARDGGHCERSTHYHRYTLDFYLLALAVARCTRDSIAAAFERAVASLAAAARVMADDTGRLPHIGDDDGGMLLPIAGREPDDISDSLAVAAALADCPDVQVGAAPEEAFWFLGHSALRRSLCVESAVPSQRSAALTETGYYVSRSTSGEHLVIDGGPHGYQNAGHAHADALSLTLSLAGMPLLIDPGTGLYTVDLSIRDRFRSTASHNTVVVDGRWQSCPSGPFHWSTATAATVHRWRTAGVFDYFDASHSGYAPVEHRRRVLALHGDALVVADLVAGPGSHLVQANWHLDPRWTADVRSRSAVLSNGGRTVGLFTPQGRLSSAFGDVESGLGWHSPAYGRIEPTTTIQLRHESTTPIWLFSVFDLNEADPIVDVESLPVWVEAGVLMQSAAIKIVRASSVAYFTAVEPSVEAARGTWRVGEFQTDARMMFCRMTRAGDLDTIAMVDGSLVRSVGRRAFGVVLSRVASAIHFDAFNLRNYRPCAVSPGS